MCWVLRMCLKKAVAPEVKLFVSVNFPRIFITYIEKCFKKMNFVLETIYMNFSWVSVVL
jgi:hypothetical protein